MTSSFPVSLTVRPACGVPGDYEYQTDRSALMRLLQKETDLPSSVLQRFEADLLASGGARLLGVDMNDRTLTEIGYFIE